jgi:hypothetical protein
MKHIYNKVLDSVSVDPRLETGIFDIHNNDHLSIFREYLVKEGISIEDSISLSNRLAEAGKFPERQAYNKDGLLVTFPSPEHKQRAIARGTHWEKNPKNAQVNIFGGDQSTNTSGSAPQQSMPSQSAAPQVSDSPAPAAQQPTTQNSASVKIAEPAVSGSSEPVNVDNRTPEERFADAQAVEKMLKTEYSLSEAISFGFYSKNNIWYNTDGEKVGRLWYVVDKNKQLILPW